MSKTMDIILARRIIAEVKHVPPEQIIQTVWAIVDGGINCVSIAFDSAGEQSTEDTLRSIAMLTDEFHENIAIGASDVFTPAQVRASSLEGAAFILSPSTNQEVIITTKALGLVSIPGAITPTEVDNACEWGADIVRLFPLSFLDIEYIAILKNRMRQIPLFAGGGITPRNIRRYLEAGIAGVSTGASLVNASLIEAKDYFAIRSLARGYIVAMVNDPPVYPE